MWARELGSGSRLTWEELTSVLPHPPHSHDTLLDSLGWLQGQALPAGAPEEGLVAAQAGAVFAQLFFLSTA